jgi:hypothetical protein
MTEVIEMWLRVLFVLLVVLFALLLGMTGVAAAEDNDVAATACTVLSVAVVSLGFRLLVGGRRRDEDRPRPGVAPGALRHSPERGRTL